MKFCFVCMHIYLMILNEAFHASVFTVLEYQAVVFGLEDNCQQ